MRWPGVQKGYPGDLPGGAILQSTRVWDGQKGGGSVPGHERV